MQTISNPIADLAKPNLQLEFLQKVVEDLKTDARVRALWLKGSLGRGKADRHSDIDLHIAVAPDDSASFRADYEARLNRIHSVLLHHELFGGSMIGTKLLNSRGEMISLHTFLETEAKFQVKEDQNRVLFDPNNILTNTPAAPASSEEICRALHVEICYFWNLFSALPSIERGEIMAAMQYLHHEVNQLIFVFALGRGRVRDVGDLRLNELLEPDERQKLEHVLTLPDLSHSSIVKAHLSLAKIMRQLGREITKKWSCEYPEIFERAVLENVTRELQRMELPFEA